MNSGPRFFWSQAILLVAVVTPLVLAERQWVPEQQWIHWGLVVTAVAVGGWSMRTRRGPLLGYRGGYVMVIAAFGLLIVELFVLDTIAVLALSHFLILVCICRLLQEQTVRDQVQFFVLVLLLLIVAAIVSGNLLFPCVLTIFLTVGARAVIRVHLLVEAGRAGQHNRKVGSQASPKASGTASGSLIGPLAALNAVMLLVGASLFVLFPRVGAGMLARGDGRAYGGSVTGLGDVLSFERIGPIHSSEQQVMTVRLEDEFGHTLGPELGEPYYRCLVFDQYGRGSHSNTWEWRSAPSHGMGSSSVVCYENEATETIPMIPGVEPGFQQGLLIQKYWLQPDGLEYLYTCYPALAIQSKQFDEVRKRISDQVIWVDAMRSASVRYEVWSPVLVSPVQVDRLARERAESSPVKVSLPVPPLPREQEIRRLIALIDEQAGTAGPLDDVDKRQQFVQAVVAFLHSARFSYTLNPTAVHRSREPIGDFLLDERRGHCEYFASALVLMCQLRGVPARIVAGYLGGDYNSVGGYYVVRQRNAHTWAEVFIPGRDWVRYDPTPPGERGGNRTRWWLRAYTYLDYLQFQWNNHVVGFDDSIRQAMFSRFADWLRRPIGYHTTWMGSVLAFIGEMVFWRTKLSPRDRLLYYVFTIMVTALVILLGYVAWRGLKWLTRAVAIRWAGVSGARMYPQADFYIRFCHRLKHLGLQRRREQTPAEFADELARGWSIFGPAPELVRAYYEVVFGGKRLSEDRRRLMDSFLLELRGLDPQRLAAAATGEPAPHAG